MTKDRLVLRLPADEAYLPLATSFVEEASTAFRLGQSEALSLTLATEEVFLHLVKAVISDRDCIEIGCTNGGYRVRVDLDFPAARLDLRTFNLTASVTPTDESSLEEMGLLLASRSVDQFQLVQLESARLRLGLFKERAYPPIGQPDLPAARPLGLYLVRPATKEEAKVLSQIAFSRYTADLLPSFLGFPGKLSDMVAAGDYQAAVAVGESETLGGGLLWRSEGGRIAECYGPYLVEGTGENSEVGEALIDHCLGIIAKTSVTGLLNFHPTPDFPQNRFERLGSLRRSDETVSSRTAWFRLLHEDPGTVCWTSPALAEFLTGQYERLVLPREIRLVRDEGENRDAHSVLFADIDRTRSSVTLHPVWPGLDSAHNLETHLQLLKAEGFREILFSLDAGQSWQAHFAPFLLDAGFQPQLILPYAGQGDMVLFQL
ncbi:MAG: hypothetical protein EHM61_24830 [Acidobacteria bacterium]|nr:MAG: hypothetical protein EHM61_24830 [Acidobacteriota bacterium]